MKFNKYTARATLTLLGLILFATVASGTCVAILEYFQPTFNQILGFVGIVVALFFCKGFIETYAGILESRDRLNNRE